MCLITTRQQPFVAERDIIMNNLLALMQGYLDPDGNWNEHFLGIYTSEENIPAKIRKLKKYIGLSENFPRSYDYYRIQFVKLNEEFMDLPEKVWTINTSKRLGK